MLLGQLKKNLEHKVADKKQDIYTERTLLWNRIKK